MVISLRYRRAMAGKAFGTLFVGGKDTFVDFRRVGLHPRKQRRSKVEADLRIVVSDAGDTPISIEYSGGGVGRVAFGGDPLIPVVKWVGGILYLNELKPRVFPWRLIKMAMNTDIAFHSRRLVDAALSEGALGPE